MSLTDKRPEMTRKHIIQKFQEETLASIALAKPVLENNLLKFNKFVLEVEEGKDKVPLAPVHKEMCEFIDKNKKKFKLALIPRGHLKSTTVTVARTLQRILADRGTRVLIANATYNNACSFLTDIKRHLKFNDKIKMFWGDPLDGVEIWARDKIMLRKPVGAPKEPTVTAMGLEGSLTSQHYDMIILDDLVNQDYVNTADQIQKTINFYKECLNLLEPGGELIVVGTRWDDKDLYGWIMDSDNNVVTNFEIFIRRAFEGSLDTDEGFQALFPQKFSRKTLLKLYEQQGPYIFSCTPKETPILMADFSEKSISEIKVGDEVVGFYRGDIEHNGKLVKSKVKSIGKYKDYVCDFTMESGRKVRCTANHKWYSRKKDRSHKIYKPARVGTKLSLVCEPTKKISGDKKLLWNYLAGFFDGDGSALGGAKILFTQSSEHNKAVYNKVLEVIKKLGLKYGEFVRKPSGNMIWINDSFNAVIDMIRYADFGKKHQLIKRLYQQSSKFVKEYDKVLEIKVGRKKEMVYGLETETGNYIAWGYASSNSQYLNDCIPSEDATFKKEWFQYYEPADLRGALLNHFTMVDPAISLEKDADYTAVVTVGIDQFQNIYVKNIVRKRMTPDELIQEIFKINEQYHPQEIAVEDVAYQKALQYYLTQEMNRKQIYLPITQVKPANRSKDQRIKGLQPLYSNGKIFHAKIVANIQQLEDELLRFPRGKHDDVIDSLSYALDIMYAPKRKVTRNHKNRYLYS